MTNVANRLSCTIGNQHRFEWPGREEVNPERSMKESTRLVKQSYGRNPERYLFNKQGNLEWVDFFVKFSLCVCLRHTFVNTVFTGTPMEIFTFVARKSFYKVSFYL